MRYHSCNMLGSTMLGSTMLGSYNMPGSTMPGLTTLDSYLGSFYALGTTMRGSTMQGSGDDDGYGPRSLDRAGLDRGPSLSLVVVLYPSTPISSMAP